MLITALLVFLNSALCMLRLGSAAFPRPLSGAEEKEYLDKWINGKDIAARNKLNARPRQAPEANEPQVDEATHSEEA